MARVPLGASIDNGNTWSFQSVWLPLTPPQHRTSESWNFIAEKRFLLSLRIPSSIHVSAPVVRFAS